MTYIFQQPRRGIENPLLLQFSIFFPQGVTLHQSDLSPVERNRSPPLSSSTTETLLQNDQSPEENDLLSPRCQNHEEEIEPFYEILPASALVPHQSPAEEVIQWVTHPRIAPAPNSLNFGVLTTPKPKQSIEERLTEFVNYCGSEDS
ncbi:hypothetical protein L3X38_031218 [Prunus dulcis]|uniref:Uncharacterized protein n=1 Tax=Prunus dulcis TaxID=3755 RepID=A0AAD4YUU2_PRUDU|nr:hypothetical protein L3X38_031218 [Prunus dulcis]